MRRWLLVLCFLPLLVFAQTGPKKRVLVIGAVHGFQHDSVSNAAGLIFQLGKQTGLWETFIRTDTQLLTKRPLENAARNLNDFDAVFFFTSGELPMTDDQKADFLSFIHDDGKGFVAAHSALDTFYTWPEYGDLIGAYFDGHPWGVFRAPIRNEAPENSITRHLPERFVLEDEIYQPSSLFSRERVKVLLSLDPEKVDWGVEGVRRADKDIAVAWTREYGAGRVFYSSLGHTTEIWERPRVRRLYLEAMKWALKITD